MKTLRILPAAAGIIALTATIGFVDGQREIEPEIFSKDGSQTKVMTLVASEGTLPGNISGLKSDSPAYLVKIERGDISKEVLIDAVTGGVLMS
jgi:hypothetical protein